MCTIGYAVCLATVVGMLLHPAPTFAQSARTRYESALSREQQLRARIDAPDAPPSADGRRQTGDEPSTVVRDAQRIISAYQALVRRYPASAYSDNALWQVAELHRLLAERFARAESRPPALGAYRQIVTEYPSSSLRRKAQAAADALERTAEVESVPHGAAETAVLTNIERTILPEGVRVTLSLDQEISYHEERIDGPARVFFDLKGVAVSRALRDASLNYGEDVVRHIRVGRHPNSTVRIVLDLEGVSRYSVFTLYNPFRLVIDCERPAAGRDVRKAEAAGRGPAGPIGPAGADVSPAGAAVRPDAPSLLSVPNGATDAPAARTTAGREPDAIPAARWESNPVATSPPAVPSRNTAPAPVPPAPPIANSLGGFSIARQLGLGASRIVIDPGHGGRDPGAGVRGLTEADLTLDVALRLEKLLQQQPGLEVILTRRTDVYIPLEERTAIANRENADLFLSIHANASRNTSARGVETYYLSFASSPEAEAVAARENAGSDRAMHNLPDIIKAIALNNKLDESRDLASMVQESLISRLRRVNTGLRDLGVKKAPFVVLIGAGMPSVLAEMSFLTHRQDAQLLKTTAYRQRIAEALNAAVLRYRRSLKGSGKVADQ